MNMMLLSTILTFYILGAMINWMHSIITVIHVGAWSMSWEEFLFYPYFWGVGLVGVLRERLVDGG